jgi:hypothetical protein
VADLAGPERATDLVDDVVRRDPRSLVDEDESVEGTLHGRRLPQRERRLG